MRIAASIVASLVSALAALSADAASFSLRGTFSRDDDRLFLAVTVTETSVVTIESFGYAGGTQADGTAVSAGGFDSVLGLFRFEGTKLRIPLITWDDNSRVVIDPVTGNSLDAFISLTLDPGLYQVTLSQSPNVPNGPWLGSGFSEVGYVDSATFTGTDFGCSNGIFCEDPYIGPDPFRESPNRTGDWAVDISGGGVSSVVGHVLPEPSTAALLALGLVTLAARRRLAN